MSRVSPIPQLFLHFFDVHFLDEVTSGRRRVPGIEEEAERATRYAALMAEKLFVPAASYFESPMCRRVIDRLGALHNAGVLVLVGGGGSVLEFAFDKTEQYDEGGAQHSTYAEVLAGDLEIDAPFRARGRSATTDLWSAWGDQAGVPDLALAVFGRSVPQLSLTFEDDWAALRERLDGRAFTPEYVAPILLGPKPNPVAQGRLAGWVNSAYFDSYCRELETGLVTDLVHLGSNVTASGLYPHLPYEAIRSELRAVGVLHQVDTCDPARLLELREDPRVITAGLRAVEAANAHLSRRGLGPQLKIVALEDLQPLVAALKATRTGRRAAGAYHRRAFELIGELFHQSFGPGQIEAEIDEGRKRLDAIWPNIAETGFFKWVHSRINRTGGGPFVVGEMKNYQDDVANPELDQLSGRFAPWRSHVGLLVCRSFKNKALFFERCRDAYQAGRGLVIPLDDGDLEALTLVGTDASWGAQGNWLLEHTKPIMA
jgi:hypothetical protein